MIPLLLITTKKEAVKSFLQKQEGQQKSVVITLKPLLSEYSISQIRELQRETCVYQPIRRIYIFEEFDHASFEAQNAFLKLLEEPPDNIEFILVVSNTYSILPTVISRTKIIRLEKEKDSPLESSISKILEAMIDKKTFSVVSFSLFTAQSKEDSLKIIKQFSLFFHSRLSIDNLAPSILSEIIKVNGLIKHNNLNHQLAIDHLLIFILKKYSMKS